LRARGSRGIWGN